MNVKRVNGIDRSSSSSSPLILSIDCRCCLNYKYTEKKKFNTRHWLNGHFSGNENRKTKQNKKSFLSILDFGYCGKWCVCVCVRVVLRGSGKNVSSGLIMNEFFGTKFSHSFIDDIYLNLTESHHHHHLEYLTQWILSKQKANQPHFIFSFEIIDQIFIQC